MNASQIADTIAQIEKRKPKDRADENLYPNNDEAAYLLANPSLSTVPDITGMLTHENYYVRMKAAEALGKRGDAAAIPALIEALEDKGHPAHCYTSLSLGGGPWSMSVRTVYDVTRIASNALISIGSPAVPALIEALKHKNERVRPYVASLLGDLGEVSAVPDLIKALQNENENVRISAARALGKIGETTAVPALIEVLDDAHAEVVLAATDALEKLKVPSAFPRIVALLKHKDEKVRVHAVQIVGKYDDPDAMVAILDSLQDESASVRCCAAYLLREVANSSAIPALTVALQDKDPSVGQYAALALARLREHSTAPALIAALSSTDLRVRNAASVALWEIGDETAVPALIAALKYPDEDKWCWRGDTIRALLMIGSPAIAPLMEVLKHNNPLIRRGIADELTIYAQQEQNIEARQTAQIVLERFKKERNSVPAHNLLAFRSRLMSYWNRLFQK